MKKSNESIYGVEDCGVIVFCSYSWERCLSYRMRNCSMEWSRVVVLGEVGKWKELRGSVDVVNRKFFEKSDGDWMKLIGRGEGELGNMFGVKDSKFDVWRVGSIEESLGWYSKWLDLELSEGNDWIYDEMREIYEMWCWGWNVKLVCWCKDENGCGMCHGDIIKNEVMEGIYI